MAFGREGGTRLGGESGLYASRQDLGSSSNTTPHWMKQLEEKYQRLHAKIVNQAARFSSARFNAINNNISNHRSFSYGGSVRNSNVNKSSISSSGVDGPHILSKRGANLSTSSALNNKREPLPDNANPNNVSRRGLKTGGKRQNNLSKLLVLESSTRGRKDNRPFPFPSNDSKLERGVYGGGGSNSAGSREGDSELTSSTPPPPGLNEVNTQPGPLRLAKLTGDAGRVTQAEIGDSVQATLAKTSAALLNSSPANNSPGQARRRGEVCTGGSRLKSPRWSKLGQQTLESQLTPEDENGRLSESVYYIPVDSSNVTSGGYKDNTVYCFEKEVSAGVTAQNTPRASKPTTRASSSLALTRLSSANFVPVSRGQSRVNEEILERAIQDNDSEKTDKGPFFVKRCDPFVSDHFAENGDVNWENFEENRYFEETDDIDDEDVDSECYSGEDDSDTSDGSGEDVFVDEGNGESVKCLGQQSEMEVVKSKGKRHSSRNLRPSVSRLGQKPHKSCPTYFWKSANPHASADEDGEEKEHGGFLKTANKADRCQHHSKKNKKNQAQKRDRRGNKNHQTRKSNSNSFAHNNSKYNNNNNNNNDSNILNNNRPIDDDSNSNRNETGNLSEDAFDESDKDPCNHTIHRKNSHHQQQSQHPKPRSDSKGAISPVLGTLLPLTARAVEEGRMRVFARMSLEARHAVDETLREMEREEEKGDREKTLGRTTEEDLMKPETMEMESTWDVSVANHTSGTRGPSRVFDGELMEGGQDLDKTKGGVVTGGTHVGSQGSAISDNPHDEFYRSGRFHNSNPNLLYTKNHTDFTHSPSSSVGTYKRTAITGQRAGSRRLPHLSDLPTPQTPSLPNPHARLPGISSKPRVPLSYRETTFEITPPDFDIRFHHIISCQAEGRETPPPDIRQQSIDKCQQWLVRHNPRQ